jgi:ATP-dependent Clp protease ATP-binding subunit ClpB
LKKKSISVEFDSSVLDEIFTVGYDATFGARPIKRAIQRNVENPLAKQLLEGNIQSGSSVLLAYDNKELKIKIL